MSLEAKIAELTLAVQALTLAMKERVVSVESYQPAQQYGIPASSFNTAVDQATITQREKEIVAEEVKAGNGSSITEFGSQCEPARETSLTYDDVKRATNNLSAAKGKEITIAALARFGVKRATELTEAQWEEYCDYTAKCVAGLDPREAA